MAGTCGMASELFLVIGRCASPPPPGQPPPDLEIFYSTIISPYRCRYYRIVDNLFFVGFLCFSVFGG